jgi:hypothetical protein
MKIFRLSWWVLPMVSVGTVAVIAAVLGCIVGASQALVRRNRAEGRPWGSSLVNTLIVALWPQVNPAVAWALTCVAWGCVPAFVVRIIPP